MSHRDPDRAARALAALHRFERAAGLYRPGRSPWVWIGPGINVVGSLVMVMWVGVAYGLGWAATIPTALVLSAFMGAMSAAFLANWEDDAEEDERRAAEEPAPPAPPPGPAHGRVPTPSPDPPLPARLAAVAVPVPRSRPVPAMPPQPPAPAPRPEREREPEPVAGASRR